MNDAAARLLALRKGIIAELWQSPRYRSLVEELKGRRPVVPYWNPKQDNTTEMQAASAAQKWHDVTMAIVNPEAYPREVE
jgi:hypothetical protein